MKIAIVHESFTAKAGYTENSLARAYAQLGHNVAIITTTRQAYHQLSNYEEIYGRFFGPRTVAPGVVPWDGCTLHRLECYEPLRNGHVAIRNLYLTLREFNPDVVQTLATSNFVSQQCAYIKWRLGYKLFTGAHQTLSVFDPKARHSARWSRQRLRSDVRRFMPGRFVSCATEKCFAVTPDCADVAVKYYGVQASKIEMSHIGVDTSRFHPARTPEEIDEGNRLRRKWNITPETLLCMYTGRFTANKNPACLAEAVTRLRRAGLAVSAVFVGDGPQKKRLESTEGCVVLPFQAWADLPSFYRAADICIWPSEESMSALDAAACGKPIILGNHIRALERVDGNGYTYETGSPESLAETIRRMRDRQTRDSLGCAGAQKIRGSFSWELVAEQRLSTYSAALRVGRSHENSTL